MAAASGLFITLVIQIPAVSALGGGGGGDHGEGSGGGDRGDSEDDLSCS